MISPSQFDVFLCHNSKDKPEVREIGQQLKQQELKPRSELELLRRDLEEYAIALAVIAGVDYCY